MRRLYTTVFIFFICHAGLQAGAWIQRANFGGDARHRATAFSIGAMGYIGLGHVNSIVDVLYDDFWRYDPASNSWTQVANFMGGLRYHASGFVIGNKAFVGCGRAPGGILKNDFYQYDPVTNSWSTIANFPGTARRGAVAFTVEGKGFVGTGQTTSGYSTDFFRYDPVLNSWGTVPSLPGAPRTSSVAFNIGDLGYVGTGDVGGGSLDFYEYNPSTNAWTQKANVGNIPRQEATGFALNGYGYIGTGDDFSSGNNFGDVWKYNPATNSWTVIEDFGGLARRYLVSFTIGNKAYAGTGTNGTNFRDFWEYDFWLSELEQAKNHFKVSAFPSPAENDITINVDGLPEGFPAGKLKLELFSMSGQCVESMACTTFPMKLRKPASGSGMYVYRLRYEDREVGRSKVIFR